MHAWIIDCCNSNGPEAQENFCMFNLDEIVIYITDKLVIYIT